MKKKELKATIEDLKGTIAGLKAGLMVPHVAPGPEHLAQTLYRELSQHGMVVPLNIPYEDLPAPMVTALRCAGIAVWSLGRESGTAKAEIHWDVECDCAPFTDDKCSVCHPETKAPTMAEAGFNATLHTEADILPPGATKVDLTHVGSKERTYGLVYENPNPLFTEKERAEIAAAKVEPMVLQEADMPGKYKKSPMPHADVSKVRCIFLGQLDNDGTIPFALMKPEQKQKWRDLVDYIEAPWVRRFNRLDKTYEAWSKECHEIRMALNAGDETTIQAAERVVRELSRATAEWKAAQSTFEETHKAYLDANNRANALIMEVSARDQRIAQLEADLEATQASFEGADAVYQTQRTELDAAQGTALALEDEVKDLKGLVKNQADVIERADKKLFDLRNDWTAEVKKYNEEIDLLKNRLGVDSEKDATLAAMREASRTSRELEAIHIQLNDAKVPVFPLSAGSQLNHRLTWLIDRVRPKDWEALAGIIKNELNRNTAVNDAVDFAVHQMKAGVK